MSEHHWQTRWNGREYVMDDQGRLILTTEDTGERR